MKEKRKAVLMVAALFFGMCISPSIIGIGETVPRFDGGMVLEEYYTLNVTVIGEGDVVKYPDWELYPEGTVVELSAIANNPWVFDHWTGDIPVCHENDNPLNVVMDNNKNITVVFIEVTVVSIEPSAQTVEKGDEFDVGIYVEPSEPIMAAAVDIYFDPTLIQANCVFDGALFGIIPTLFDPGTIDNINGKITGIMDMILCNGDVSDIPGYLCNILFTAQQKLGTSPIDLEDVLVVDEFVEALPITVNDGEVTVGEEPPQITDVTMKTSNPLDTSALYGWENVSCTVTDAGVGVDEVKLVVTDNDAVTTEYPMTNIPDTDFYYYNTTFTYYGYYIYSIWANDAEGNNATSISQLFALPPNYDVNMDGCVTDDDFLIPPPPYDGAPGWIREDVNNDGRFSFSDFVLIAGHYGECWPVPSWILPKITNVILTTSEPLDTEPGFGWENFTCTVTSVLAVNQVKLIVTWPDTTIVEYPMTNILGTDTYYVNTTFIQGCCCDWWGYCTKYTYYIWANDTIGNGNISETEILRLPRNEDVNMDGHIYIQDFVLVAGRYGETGANGWIREDVNNDGNVYIEDFVMISRHYGRIMGID